MISAMDQHASSLVSLGFSLNSPGHNGGGGGGGGSGGGGSGGSGNGNVIHDNGGSTVVDSPVNSTKTSHNASNTNPGPPPPLYDSTALYTVNSIAVTQTSQQQQHQELPSSQHPLQQHQHHQPAASQQHQNQPQQQQQQQQQQQHHHHHHQQQQQQQHNIINYNFNNLDTSYLFPNTGTANSNNGGMDVAVTTGVIYSQGMGQQHHAVCSNQLPAADQPDTKECIEELCPVCGDKVSGYHYGLLTCESCKGFFKRTVQNKKVYTCVAERSCHIDKTQRKRCPFCRFQKCLEVGMKLEAVRADRMRGGRNKFGPMYKRDRARKLQMMRQRQIAVQTLRGSQYGIVGGDGAAISFSYPTGISSPFSNLNIKQEIQIPQVSSLTSSPDSSPSPIAVALGQAININSIAAGSTNSHNQQPTLQIVAAGSGSSNNNTSTANNPTSSANNGLSISDHKLWGTPNSTTSSPHTISPKSFQFEVNSTSNASKVSSPLIRDFISGLDDREWQNSLFSLLQSQTYNQCEVDLFELMCKVLDQNLFSQVDWARNSVFFKDLNVDDQMKLLQHSWSDMLVLDHIHHRMHNSLPDETNLSNGQTFDLLSLGLLGVPSLQDRFKQVTLTLHDLKFDVSDYICLKFLLLLNPDVRGLMNRRHVQESHERVRQALLEYCLSTYPQVQDKFNKLMSVMPDIHEIAARGEEHLYREHCTGHAPMATLLMEMLHAKRR